MDFILFVLSFTVVLLALGLFTNRARDRRNIPFELEANCLLTRYPILFVTGPRSLFYFARYWNIYTSFLAEHGYEVYTVHLPWRNSAARLDRFKDFLAQQEQHDKKFHLVLDSISLQQFSSFLRDSRPVCVESITELATPQAPDVITGLSPFPLPFERVTCLEPRNPKQGAEGISFALHRLLNPSPIAPTLSTLGGHSGTALSNSKLLLHRCLVLAERDLQRN